VVGDVLDVAAEGALAVAQDRPDRLGDFGIGARRLLVHGDHVVHGLELIALQPRDDT
jgi:hypothetical protein